MTQYDKGEIERIKNEINKLTQQIEVNKQALQRIHDLLKKADQKLKEEVDQREHWLGIIEHLENSLIQIRSEISGSEARLTLLKKEYADQIKHFSGDNIQLPDQPLLTKEEEELIQEREITDSNLASQILQISPEKLGELSLGEISQIILGMKTEKETQDRATEIAPPIIETTNDQEVERTIRSDPTKLKMRDLLVSALNKVWNNKADQLTQEEKKIILKAFQHLDRKRRKSPQEDRLHRVMSAAVRIAFHKHL